MEKPPKVSSATWSVKEIGTQVQPSPAHDGPPKHQSHRFKGTQKRNTLDGSA